jgi:hypothetical protein
MRDVPLDCNLKNVAGFFYLWLFKKVALALVAQIIGQKRRMLWPVKKYLKLSEGTKLYFF